MLIADEIVKSYGGVSALAGATLTLRPGQVHALLGENGAGKSTLVRIVTGLLQPDAGSLILDGVPVRWGTPTAARAAGVATVSQELSLFPDLDLLANLFSQGTPTRWGMHDRPTMLRRAQPHLAALGLGDLDPRTLLGELSLAEQQLVEIARALIAGPSVLVLDEPTSALGAAATERLLGLVREIADSGVAVLYVSHFLQEVTAIADRVTVLRDGKSAMRDRDMRSPDAPGIPDLVRAMLGSGEAQPAQSAQSAQSVEPVEPVLEPVEPDQEPRPVEPVKGDLVLRLQQVGVPGAVTDVDLEVHRGEIVGLAGLQGAGHEALLGLLWGLHPGATGQVKMLRSDGVPKNSVQALRAGAAFIPSDRKRLGLMLDKPVWENITAVTALASQGSSWRLSRPALRAVAQHWIDELRIRCTLDTPASALSGGNQQKVVFAKWLATDPGLLLLDDPTRGVDVGAKREMHALIQGVAAEGRSVVICSTDLAELADLCDRVLVLRRGRPATTASQGRMSESSLLQAMNQASG